VSGVSLLSLKKTRLFDGMRELLQREIIDSAPHTRPDELRLHRNLAGPCLLRQFLLGKIHRTLFDFAVATCDDVFVLNHKSEQFTRRAKGLGTAKGAAKTVNNVALSRSASLYRRSRSSRSRF
jgi:hypothetical protein